MAVPISGALAGVQVPAAPTAAAAAEPEVCGVCKGAGWLRTDSTDPTRVKTHRCECQRPQHEARQKEHRRRVSNLAGVEQFTFDSFDPLVSGVNAAYMAAKTFAARPEGWLVLHGPVGVGKTHLAAAVANTLERSGASVVFQVVPDLLDHFRAAYKPGAEVGYDELFEAVKSADVLVLDDLGAERGTDWVREKLFQLVDHRWLRRLPLVVTTNRTPRSFRTEAEQRLASRLFDEGLVAAIAINGGDYRQRGQRDRKRAGGPAPWAK